MAPLLVTGSIGIDTIRTPHAISENCLGGSSVYFCMAASFLCPVRLVGVIGDDCPFDLHELFAGKDVDLAGLEVRKGSKTFRWEGTYYGDMDQRSTDLLELNVLAEAPPAVPAAYRDSRFVFLANTAPALQLQLLKQLDSPTFVAADTIKCWIKDNREDLERLLAEIHCLIINDEEAVLLAGHNNLTKATEQILKMGPGTVIVKKGKSGSFVCDSAGRTFVLPAYPTVDVKDPTGAGDSFAGGLLGYLASVNSTEFEALKEAMVYGTVLASSTIADFSINALMGITKDDVEKRALELKRTVRF